MNKKAPATDANTAIIPRDNEFFTHLENRLTYKKVTSNSSTVTMRPAFSTHAEEEIISWKEFHEDYKPYHEGNKENQGWA